MYDSGKVVTGIIVFVGVVTFPLWYSFAAGDPSRRPELQKPQGQCVESTDYMRAFHMDLLNQWRDDAVREGKRVYASPDGRKHWISLSYDGQVHNNAVASKSCMDCHSSKEKFCDECHDYVGVTPYCWDCHIEPKGDR